MAGKIPKERVIAGLVIAGAVGIIGIALWKTRRKTAIVDEELQFASRSQPITEGHEKTETKTDTSLDKLASELLNEFIAPATTTKTFAELGITIQVPKGWEASMEEITEMVPIIRVCPPGFESVPPGELPTITIIVEDVAREQMTLLEYKEKSKSSPFNLGMQEPQYSKDEPISLGNFKHILEYTQVFPTSHTSFTPYKFLSLMTLHNGIAYVVQYMSRVDKYHEFIEEAKKLATTLVIDDLPARKPSHIEYVNSPFKLRFTLPETWTVTHESKGASDLPESGGKCKIASFETNSIMKKDSIKLYKLLTASPTAQELAEKCISLYSNTTQIESKGDVAKFDSKSSERTIRVYCSKDYVMEVRPEGEMSNTPTVQDETIISILNAIAPSTTDVESSTIRYHNNHFRFSFQLRLNGHLKENKWGSSVVFYSPLKLDENSEQPEVGLCVEVNKEDEPCPSLKVFEEKLLAESDPSQPFREKKIINVRGREYLTFIISRDQVSFFGTKEEYKTKICITLRGDEVILLKWEVPANEWARYERYLNPLIESFELGE